MLPLRFRWRSWKCASQLSIHSTNIPSGSFSSLAFPLFPCSNSLSSTRSTPTRPSTSPVSHDACTCTIPLLFYDLARFSPCGARFGGWCCTCGVLSRRWTVTARWSNPSIHQLITHHQSNNATAPCLCAGESYGGHYVTTTSAYIVKQNLAGGNPLINFQGFAGW